MNQVAVLEQRKIEPDEAESMSLSLRFLVDVLMSAAETTRGLPLNFSKSHEAHTLF